MTPDRIKELFVYDPESGLMTRRVAMGPNKRFPAGSVAGTVNAAGYIQLEADGCRVYAHRAAFVFMTGDWPRMHVDHINGIKNDNRWANLRDVDRSTNLANLRRAMRHSRTGVLGVSYDASRRKYWGEVRLPDGRRRRKRFATIAEADEFCRREREARESARTTAEVR